MGPTDAPVWGPVSEHILHIFAYAQLIRSLLFRPAISSSLLGPHENIVFLAAPVAILSSLSDRDHNKEKEPPKDDSPNRRRSSAPISASLFRYYSASPNASVIRIDLLDLTIADAGVTLDLDKDWHPDLYENRNAGATWFIFFKHINNPLSVDDLLAGFQSTSPVLFLRLGTKKAPQLGLKCLFLSMD